MAIPQHFIDDLLARVNIVDVIDARVKLKRTGKNYSAICPFHKEKSPSFSVNPDKQFYYCFGCGAGGNALGFIMDYEHSSFPEAVEELAKTLGLEVPREHDRARDVEREKRVKQQYDVLEQASAFYQQQLRSHSDKQKAVEYLKGRGLSGQIAKRFGIGFAPPGWDNLLSEISKERPDAEELLLKSGLLIENEERGRKYDRFRDRIMFPIRDVRGRVIAFGGRVLTDEKPKYLNSPETDTFHKSRELYGLYEARQSTGSLTRLMVVEGYMDVVSLAQHGLDWSVATLGTACTEQHLERIFKIVPEVVFCFDGDAAGRKAARRALDNAMPVMRDGLMARYLFLPEGEDPDTLIRTEGLDAFTARVSEALPFSEFFFKALSEDLDLSIMDGKAQFSMQAMPLLQTMQPSVLQQMMMDRICDLTGLTMEQINSVVSLHSKVTSQNRLAAPSSAAMAPVVDEAPPIDDYAPVELSEPTYFDEMPVNGGAKSYTPRKSSQGSRIDLIASAISIVLHRPDLSRKAVNAAEFDGVKGQNIELLRDLLEYFQASEEHSFGTLMFDWEQNSEKTPYLLVLNEISHVDPLLESVDAERLLTDALGRILERKYKAELEQLTRRARERPLSDDEKRRLQALLMRSAT
ncbi:MAG: DNA primase [Oceanospirillaceae bacterium]|nr:DNA primase [Oceanospirillaceae bacterium]